MSGPEVITPTPTSGKVMMWWGTGEDVPTDGDAEEIIPKPVNGHVMVWYMTTPPDDRVSVGMILAN